MSATKLAEPLLPDLAGAPKIRRAPKHDFKDGRGRVFAHRHDNGGGWVADTAWVAPTARVGSRAQVSHYARVHDNCEIIGTATVGGHARLFDRCKLSQRAVVFDSATLRDDCHLTGNARVGGIAVVSGQTTIYGRVLVQGWARVHNSELAGPLVNSNSTVGGHAQITNSRLRETFIVFGASLCDDATLTNVCVHGDAHVIKSTLNCRREWRYFQYTAGRTPECPQPAPENVVLNFAGIAVHSTLSCPPMPVSARVAFLYSRLHIEDIDDSVSPFFFNRSDTQRFVDVLGYGFQNLLANLARSNHPSSSVSSPVAAASPCAFQAPNFAAVRQRRVMRLEDKS